MNIRNIAVSFALTASLLLSSGCSHDAEENLSAPAIGFPASSYTMTPEQRSNQFYFLTKEEGFTDVYDFHQNTRTIWMDYDIGDKNNFVHLEECSMAEQIAYSALKAEHFGGPSYIPVELNGAKFEFDGPK